MRFDKKLIYGGALFALVIGSARVLILAFGSSHLDAQYLAALALGYANEFTVGLLLCAGVVGASRPGIRQAALFTGALIVLIKLASFHYERVFGKPPGADVLYYLGEVSRMSGSLNASLPVTAVLTESLLVLALLYLGIRRLRRQPVGSRGMIAGLLVLPIVSVSVSLQLFPGLVPKPFFAGSRESLAWLVQSALVDRSYDLAEIQVSEREFRRFLNYHGQSAVAPLDPEYPTCRPGTSVSTHKPGRNVIVVILESVSSREVNALVAGQPLMPNLRRIIADNLYFPRIRAAGHKSVQALPAIFSGLPASPQRNVLWSVTNFDGFPRKLKRSGYETAYFHGSDLSFENQRAYLRSVGFDLLWEMDAERPWPVRGWGYDDRVRFSRLQDWIERRGERPWLAALFTLSTHDPFVLPPDHNVTLAGQPPAGMAARVARAYRFADAQLGRFYDWFTRQDETLLVITGDHARHNVKESLFEVPLVIAGLSADELARYRPLASRHGAAYDIPATVMGLIGQSPHRCNLGVDLLAPATADRIIYASGMDSIHFWRGASAYQYDQARGEFRVGDQVIGNQALNQLPPMITRFFSTLIPVHYYLLEADAYFPPPRAESRSLPPTTRPLFISHRGNLDGPGPVMAENRADALDAVVDSAIEWAEVDVQLSADGRPILIHDDYVVVSGEKRYIRDMTLAQLRALPGYEEILTLTEAIRRYGFRLNLLIEVKSPRHVSDALTMVPAVVDAIRQGPGDLRVIVDSFSAMIAQSIKARCDCEVGFDAPFKQKPTPQMIARVRHAGLDWIYLHYSVVDAEVIDTAHKAGLKVMAYTVNDRQTLARWSVQDMPDGIITDRLEIMQDYGTGTNDPTKGRP